VGYFFYFIEAKESIGAFQDLHAQSIFQP